MSNPMTLREIESKLPQLLAIKWSEMVQSCLVEIGDKNKMHYENKMSKLMLFLEEERDMASYRLNVMGRPRSSKEDNSSKSTVRGQFNNTNQSYC